MKRTLKNCVLSLSVLLACSAAAFADGNAFTPLNFDDTAYGTPVRTSSASSDRKSTRLNSSHDRQSRMPSSA